MAEAKTPPTFFIVKTDGTPLTQNTPKFLESFAKTVAYNRTPLHALYSDGKLTLGTLIFNRGLKSRLLGRGACVVFSQHDIKPGGIHDAIVRHFESIASIKGQAESEKSGIKGLNLDGAHFVNFSCDGRYTLKVGLDGRAPKDAVPLGVFSKYLEKKTRKERVALGVGLDGCLRKRLEEHSDAYHGLSESLTEHIRNNPDVPVEKGKLTFCQVRKPFLE